MYICMRMHFLQAYRLLSNRDEPSVSEPIPPDAAVLAWTRLIRAKHLAAAAVEADLKGAGFPPLAWYDVLLELCRADGALRPSAFEGRLLLAQPNVSRLIDRLATAGLVERRSCDEDGRGQVVAITDAGRELRARMWPVYGAAIARHVGDKLGGEGAATLAALLQVLIDAPGPLSPGGPGRAPRGTARRAPPRRKPPDRPRS